MPLYALNDENRLIAADDADPWRLYRCVECLTPVRKRAGPQRRSHFYHLQRVRSCRLHSDRQDHLILQTDLQKQNPALEIERPFEKILRIADLCWEEQKLIFEIQCSPIAPPEAERRSKDYREEGYDLIWLLDDRLYNRRALRPSETTMRRSGGYYVSLKGSAIYDQFEVLGPRSRLAKGPSLPIDLRRPHPLISRPAALTNELQKRQTQRYFCGDLFDRAQRYPGYLQKLIDHEELILAERAKTRSFIHWMRKGFYIALEYLLRRSAKN
jgi:competence protein CoiA